MLAFADYCRSSLRRPAAFVRLEDELGHVDAYLSLEQARFGDSLEIERRIAPSALDALVPPFLVQPLVENAIKHGKTDRPLRVTIRADVRFGRLRVTVRDNGRGIPREDAERVLELGVGSGAAGPRPGLRAPARARLLRRGRPRAHRLLAALRHRRLGAGAGRPTRRVAGGVGEAMALLALIVDDEAPGARRAALPARPPRRRRGRGRGGVGARGAGAGLARRLRRRLPRHQPARPDRHRRRARARRLAAQPAVVFVTAHDDQAVQAFAVDAVDYLLKPVSEERLATSIARVRTMRSGEGPGRGGPDGGQGAGGRRRRDGAARPGRHRLRRGRRRPRLGRQRRPAPALALDARARGPAAADGLLPHPPLGDGQPAPRRGAGAVGPGRFAVRLADGTRLEVARRQTKALRRQLGLAG